jgi:pimeloyl-ACP methyl ester carboxylesterase
MEQWCLAMDRVRYVGEPVAVVLARNRDTAEDALEQVAVEYRPLPPIDLVIGGQHPFVRNMGHLRRMVRAGINGGRDTFLAAFRRTFGPADGAFAARLRAADLQAYLALLQDRPGLDELLPQISAPCCLYAGEADDIWADAKAASDRIPGATFLSFPGLDHCQTFLRGDLVLPRVMAFLHSAVT